MKQSTDIISLCQSYGLKLERKGKDFFTSCPFHADDTPSLSINPEQNIFYCMSCGEKGNVYHLVQKLESITFPQAFEKLPGPREGVYGIHDSVSDTVYLTESVIDALSLNQIGITSVLALHGVNGFTPVHEAWLNAKHIKTVYLVLDGDRAGREASVKLKELLKQKGYSCHALELPNGEAPNSYFCAPSGAAAGNRTFNDLNALPGNPNTTASTELTLTKNGDEYTTTISGRTYLIRGLTGYGFEKMRLTIKVTLTNAPSRFCIDNLDLYSARARGLFVEGLAKELNGSPEIIHHEVKTLITALEKERLALQDQTSDSQRPAMTKEEKTGAVNALKDKNLFKNLLKDFEACGVIGEERAKVLGYIGTVSRLLPRPLGILIVSRSGAGKPPCRTPSATLSPRNPSSNTPASPARRFSTRKKTA